MPGLKDGGRSRQRRDSSSNRRKSGSGNRVEESKSDMEWQPWMCLQNSEKKKGEFIF